MELLTYKDEDIEYIYYLDKRGVRVLHGESKDYHANGQLWIHAFRYHGKLHGEFKIWNHTGSLRGHCFYVHGKDHPYVEMNTQEKLLFQIQHPGFKFLDDV